MAVLDLAFDVGIALFKVVMAGIKASKEEREMLYARVEEILREGLDACVSARAEHAKSVAEVEKAFEEQRKKLEFSEEKTPVKPTDPE